MVYLDNNATTPLDPAVVDKMTRFLGEHFGNPSSLYPIGRQVKEMINEARDYVARALGATKAEIYFTGSGTESDNQAILGVIDALPEKGEFVTSTIEHPAVQETAAYLEKKGYLVKYVPVDGRGVLSLEALRDAVTSETALVSIMHANNEIGTIQPIAEVSRIAHEHGALVHTDAVQTFGKIPLDVSELGADLLSVSSHKIYGPKGVGALYVRKGTPIRPLLHGGHQERGLRAGTENTVGIIGFGEAARILPDKISPDRERLIPLAERLQAGIVSRIPKVRMNGHPDQRIKTTLSASVLGLESEAILLALATKGIYVSTGSACSEESDEVSHVLTAIGLRPEFARSTVRMSLGRFNTEADIDIVLAELPEIVAKLRKISAFDPEEF
jgi:cysteine desulfurase